MKIMDLLEIERRKAEARRPLSEKYPTTMAVLKVTAALIAIGSVVLVALVILQRHG